MSRMEIVYQGLPYSIAVEDPDAFRAEVLESIASGTFRWLQVDRGEGQLEPINLLVGPGIGIAMGTPDGESQDTPSSALSEGQDSDPLS
ncbi:MULTISPECIES: hypothetical protein [unclassified Plantibacter]|uniref:hypothetical protein n=1 Tax=unclassified Plantibacter TaxID=2624265 RepID=UPI000A5AC4D5|nr:MULTISPECIES: hypothetical protein [unclassified Plantibacter]